MKDVRFFFFKQKTAYEMRISDWSSDVCSSDLCGGFDIDLIAIEPDLAVARPIGRIDLQREAEARIIGIAEDREESTKGVGLGRRKTGPEGITPRGICGDAPILLDIGIADDLGGLVDIAKNLGLGVGNGEHEARFDKMIGHAGSWRKEGLGPPGFPASATRPDPRPLPALLSVREARRRSGARRTRGLRSAVHGEYEDRHERAASVSK